jgi:NAD(P)-dependent dehydrogenase (short-subunit alcohol dehydrogenase family)
MNWNSGPYLLNAESDISERPRQALYKFGSLGVFPLGSSFVDHRRSFLTLVFLIHTRFRLVSTSKMTASSTIVLVTGGNNGVGLATCELFANQSNYHVIMGSRSLEKGQKALSSIESLKHAGSISLVRLDIDSDESIAAAVKEVESKFGKLDVLINNAGVSPLDFARASFLACMQTNAVSQALMTEAFAPLLEKGQSKRVVYVSSELGSITDRSDPKDMHRDINFKAYRAAKAALNMLTACDAWEYESKGFKVFAYCPGYVVSDLAGLRAMKEQDSNAKQPHGSARGLLLIAEGKRDAEASQFLHDEKPGQLYPW